MEGYLSGLSTPEVLERRERGEGGAAAEQITKTRSQIVRENLFTLFNFLNFLIAALLFAVGAYSNMLFIAIIILNIVIGIAQELKAKKLVDELSILNRPTVTVRRDGEEMTVGIEEIVKDDLIVLASGSQICNDAVVMSGSLEVNESLLTGESDAVVKEEGAELLSGSSVISGKAYARVPHVGNENYATRLANEVKKEKQVHSELLGSMRKVTKFTSFLIIPLGIVLFLEAFVLRGTPVDEAVVSSAAALLGMHQFRGDGKHFRGSAGAADGEAAGETGTGTGPRTPGDHYRILRRTLGGGRGTAGRDHSAVRRCPGGFDPAQRGTDTAVFQKRRGGRQSHFRGPYQDRVHDRKARRAGALEGRCEHVWTGSRSGL